MKFYQYITFCFLFMTLFSCKKKDETSPVIGDVTYTISSNDSLFAGGGLKVQVKLTDNLNLGGVSVTFKEQILNYAYKAYRYEDTKSILSIANKDFSGEFTFSISDSALAAPYVILVEAFDRNGNTAIPVTKEVYLYALKMPVINFDGVSLAIVDTNRFEPKGLVTAYRGVKSVTAKIQRDGALIYDKAWSYQSGVFSWSLDSIGSVLMTPGFAEANILIKSTDLIGNVSYKRAAIQP